MPDKTICFEPKHLLHRRGAWACFWGVVGGLVLLMQIGCKRVAEPTTPIAPVYASLYLQASQYRALLSPGGIVTLTTPQTTSERLGYAGLVVVRALLGDEYYVFDLACPYERGTPERIQILDLEMRCPKCGSTYEVLHGSGAPTSGPSQSALRRYKTHYDALSGRLTLSN